MRRLLMHLRSIDEGVDHVALEDCCIGAFGDGWAGCGLGLRENEINEALTSLPSGCRRCW